MLLALKLFGNVAKAQCDIKCSVEPDFITYKTLSYSDFRNTKIMLDSNYYRDSMFHDSVYRYNLLPKSNEYETNCCNVAASALSICANVQVRNDTLFYCIMSIFSQKASHMILHVPSILLHEQIHFDICELYARKIRAQIGKAIINVNRMHTIDTIVMIERGNNEGRNVNFDNEVIVEEMNNKSLSSGKIEKKWQTAINDELTSLDAYKNPYGYILLKE